MKGLVMNRRVDGLHHPSSQIVLADEPSPRRLPGATQVPLGDRALSLFILCLLAKGAILI